MTRATVDHVSTAFRGWTIDDDPSACTVPAIHATQEHNMHDAAPSAPFLTWAGGKRQLVPRVLALAPARIDTYYVPFADGGVVSLTAAKQFAHAVVDDASV